MSKQNLRNIKAFIDHKNIFAILVSGVIFICSNLVIYTWNASSYIHKIDETYRIVKKLELKMEDIDDLKIKVTSLKERFDDHVSK